VAVAVRLLRIVSLQCLAPFRDYYLTC
jgi:hypothetical protein